MHITTSVTSEIRMIIVVDFFIMLSVSHIYPVKFIILRVKMRHLSPEDMAEVLSKDCGHVVRKGPVNTIEFPARISRMKGITSDHAQEKDYPDNPPDL